MKTRLALVEERIFSHTDSFERAKLFKGNKVDNMITVHHLHSIIGQQTKKWYFGVISQKQDTNYYLEDNSFCVRLSFAELEYADPDAFFTENCIVMVQGYHSSEQMTVTRIEHPPVHATKHMRFKLHE